MKTPKIGNISAKISKNKKNKFNFSHDNNTSYDWGSVQPILSQLMMPDSSINVNIEQLTRLAPMVVPTFGRVKMKNVAHFIPMKEIFPNWEYFLSKKPVSRNSNSDGSVYSFTPDTLPHINNSILVAFALAGAKMNVYFNAISGDTDFATNNNNWICVKNDGTYASPTWSTATVALREIISKLTTIPATASPSTNTLGSINYTGYIWSMRNFTRGSLNDGTALNYALLTSEGDSFVTLPTPCTMVAYRDTSSRVTHSINNETLGNSNNISEPITFDGADLIWESDEITAAKRADTNSIWYGVSTTFFDGRKIRVTFKLSSFGKRLRKILIALGYNFSLNDSSEVSILPLLAFYKAYWDTYAPQRDKNFYMTQCWKLIQAVCNDSNYSNLTYGINVSGNTGLRSIFKKFIMSELGNVFATEKIDAISAATDKPLLTRDNNGNAAAIQLVNDALGDWYSTFAWDQNNDGRIITKVESTSPSQYTPSIGTNDNSDLYNLTQPVIDGLKKAYIYVNKASVAGMNIAEILRMNGQGSYVEECNGKFINAEDEPIKISDVVSTSDTINLTGFTGVKGAALGQYGGKGLGVSEHQFSYSTDKAGYMIILSCIVPDAGYVNGVNKTNEFITFGDWYNPEFDGLAYEAIQKKQIVGSTLLQNREDTGIQQTFGYLPTYSNYKFRTNVANGDFSLNSRKTSTMPYTLDKYIPVLSTDTQWTNVVTAHPGTTQTVINPEMTYNSLPNAGEDWRYVNKMAWNGNYDRIFRDYGDGINWTDNTFGGNNNDYLFNSFEYDNFLTHNVFDVAYWAPMKAIEDSYSTYDTEHAEGNGSIKKQ